MAIVPLQGNEGSQGGEQREADLASSVGLVLLRLLVIAGLGVVVGVRALLVVAVGVRTLLVVAVGAAGGLSTTGLGRGGTGAGAGARRAGTALVGEELAVNTLGWKIVSFLSGPIDSTL